MKRALASLVLLLHRLLFDYTKLGGKALMEARGVTGIKSGMPGLGDAMSDEEIWDVLTYIRSTWLLMTV